MKIHLSTNLDVVTHRSVLRKPIDAIKRATGTPVAARNRSRWEALRLFDVRPRAALPLQAPPTLPPANADGAGTFDGDALAKQIADQAITKVSAMPGHDLLGMPPKATGPTIFVSFAGPSITSSLGTPSSASTPNIELTASSKRGGNGSSDGDAPVSSNLLQPSSLHVSPVPSASSSETVLQTTSTDVLGRTEVLCLRYGGMKRMAESLPLEVRDAFRSVIDQARSAERIEMLDQASETSPGMASFPVQLEGHAMTAFLSFDESGRITTVDASDESLRPQFEAIDAGRPIDLRGTAPASGSSRQPVVQPLTPTSGVHARVDVSSQVQRKEIGEGCTGYTYEPMPDIDHGIWAQTSPGGKLWLGLIATRPELSGTLGSGTDMVLGLAQAINRDGVGVKEIVGVWGQGEGLDSQHAIYCAARAAGRSEQQAAMSTFFGKVARMFGFTDVQVGSTPTGDFNVTFKRPPADPAV
jgi:hypothetical protein